MFYNADMEARLHLVLESEATPVLVVQLLAQGPAAAAVVHMQGPTPAPAMPHQLVARANAAVPAGTPAATTATSGAAVTVAFPGRRVSCGESGQRSGTTLATTACG